MSRDLESAVYEGRIRHRRFEPFRRDFEYRMFMTYLDLDELPEVMSIHPLWSGRSRSPARFRRADYLGPEEVPLREAVLDLVEVRTGQRPAGPVRMLTHLRYWGVCFNPVTFYYCFDREGTGLETVLAEVTNTPWGERHTYLVDRAGDQGVLAAEVGKQLHVSPLMSMDHRYQLSFGEPGRTLSVHMESHRLGDLHFDATLRMERRRISRSMLGRLLFTHVPMPMKVLGGIHFEAFRTWLAGAKFHPHDGDAEHRDLPDGQKSEKLCPVGTTAGSRTRALPNGRRS